MDKMFAEIAKAMPKAASRKKPPQDPRIKELISERMRLARSPDGRQRFRITSEIRKLVRADSNRKKGNAIKDAFAKHTTWAKKAQERRIERPEAAPVFTVDGKPRPRTKKPWPP